MKTISCTALAAAVGGIVAVSASAGTTVLDNNANVRGGLEQVGQGLELDLSPNNVNPRTMMSQRSRTYPGFNGGINGGMDNRHIVRLLNSSEFDASRVAPDGSTYNYDVFAGVSGFGLALFSDAAAWLATFTENGFTVIDADPANGGTAGADHVTFETVSVNPTTGNTEILLTHTSTNGFEIFPDGFFFLGDDGVAGTPDDVDIDWDLVQLHFGINQFNIVNTVDPGVGDGLPVGDRGADNVAGPNPAPDGPNDDATAAELDPIRLDHGVTGPAVGVGEDLILFGDVGLSPIGPRSIFEVGGDAQIGAGAAFNNIPSTVIGGVATQITMTNLQGFSTYAPSWDIDEATEIGGITVYGGVPGSWGGTSGIQLQYTVDPNTAGFSTAMGLCCVGGVESETSRDACLGTFYGFDSAIGDFSCVNTSLADLDDTDPNIFNERASSLATSDSTTFVADNFNAGCDAAGADLTAFDEFTPYEQGTDLSGTPLIAEEAGPTAGATGSFEGTLFTLTDPNELTDVPLLDQDAWVVVFPQSGSVDISFTAEAPATISLLAGDATVAPAGDAAAQANRLDSNVGEGCGATTLVGVATAGVDGASASLAANVDAGRFYYIEVEPAVLDNGAGAFYGQALGGTALESDALLAGLEEANEGSVAYQFSTVFSTTTIPGGGTDLGACIAADGSCTIDVFSNCPDALFEPGVTDCLDSNEACFDPWATSPGDPEGETEVCDAATAFQPTFVVDSFNDGGGIACDTNGDLDLTGADAISLSPGDTVNGETGLYSVFIDYFSVVDDGMGGLVAQSGTGDPVDTEDPGFDPVNQAVSEVQLRDLDSYLVDHAGGDLVFNLDAQFSASVQVLRLTCEEDAATPGTFNAVADLVLEADTAVDNSGALNLVEDLGVPFGIESFNIGSGLDICSSSTLTAAGAAAGTYILTVTNDFDDRARCEPGLGTNPSRYSIGLDGVDPILPCAGDVDGDGGVGPDDLFNLLAAFGTSAGDPTFNAAADVDPFPAGDGFIGPDDLFLLLSNFGRSNDPAAGLDPCINP